MITERQWQSAFESIAAGICILDGEGKILQSNKAMSELALKSPGELVGRSPCEFLHGSSEHLENCPWIRVQETRKREHAELQIKDKWFEVTVDPILDAENRLIGSIHIASDITERKRVEEQIKQRNRELAAFNDIANVVSQSLNLNDILNAALDKVLEVIHADVGGIYFSDPLRRTLDLVVHRGVSPDFTREVGSISVDEKTLEAATAEGKFKRFILSAKAILKDRVELGRILRAMKKEGLSLIRGVPVLLYAKDGIVGLMIVTSRMPRKFSEAELKLLTSISQQLSMAIENARLFEASRQELTERRRAEEALREAKEFSEDLIASMQDGFSILDSHGVHIDVNHALCQMTGFSREELIGVGPPHPYWPPEAYQEIESAFQKSLRGEFGPFELTFMRKNGERFPVIVSPSWIKDKQRNAIIYYATFKDITERKRAEEALQESEARLRGLFETMVEGVILIAPDGQIVQANPAAERILGLKRPEIEGRNYVAPEWKIFRLDGTPMPPEEMAGPRAMKDKRMVKDVVMGVQRPDGSIAWINVSAAPIINEAGKFEGIVGTFADITDRKRAEEELRKSEERFRNLFEQAPLGYQSLDAEGCLIDVNQSWLDLLGYSRDEVIGHWFGDFLAPHEIDAYKQRFPRFKAIGEVHVDLEMVQRAGSTIIVHIDGRIGRDDNGQFKKTHCILHDITERKRAEEALIKSELRFRTYFNMPLIGFAITSPEKGWIEVNDRICSILGYSRDEIVQRTWPELTHPDDLAADIEQFDLILSGQIEKYSMDKRFIRKDGEIVWTSISIGCVRKPDGRVEYIIGLMEDITERKQAEEALRESEVRYHSLFEGVPVGLYRTTPDGQILDANQALVQMLGYPDRESLPAINVIDGYVNPQDRVRWQTLAEREGEVRDFEVQWRRHDGTIIWVTDIARAIRDGEGRVLYYEGAVKDITERKRAEEALRESEEKLRVLFEQLPIGVSLLDQSRKMIYANPALEKILAISRGDLLKGKYQNRRYIRPDGTSMPPEEYASARAFQEQQPVHDVETGVITESGKTIWTSVSAAPFPMAGKGVVITTVDIAERKRAEEEIVSLAKFPSENPDPVLRLNQDGIVMYANKAGHAVLSMWGCAIGDRAPQLWSDLVFESLASGENKIVDTEFGEKAYSFFVAPVAKAGYVNFYGRDITDQKRAQEELLASRQELRALSARLQSLIEKERTALAREIHDELGQALTALKMDLAWLSNKLPKTQPLLLKKAQSMSEVITATVQTVKRLSTQLRPGLLDDLGLVAAMEWQAQEFSQRTGIKMKISFQPEDLALEPDLSTAIFRIFQELLTNVARHAKASRVVTSLIKKAGKLELRVRDNGRGIKKKEISSSKSFGLIGMRERVYSFGGEIEIEGIPGKGTTAIVRIPEKGKSDDKNSDRR